MTEGPWDPKKRLNRQAMESLRMMHQVDPEKNNISTLSRSFGISADAVVRILHSKFIPSQDTDARQERNKHEAAISARRLRSKLTDGRLDDGAQSRTYHGHDSARVVDEAPPVSEHKTITEPIWKRTLAAPRTRLPPQRKSAAAVSDSGAPHANSTVRSTVQVTEEVAARIRRAQEEYVRAEILQGVSLPARKAKPRQSSKGDTAPLTSSDTPSSPAASPAEKS
jgi:hypothetical protein